VKALGGGGIDDGAVGPAQHAGRPVAVVGLDVLLLDATARRHLEHEMRHPQAARRPPRGEEVRLREVPPHDLARGRDETVELEEAIVGPPGPVGGEPLRIHRGDVRVE
jgi:hypothetical protein